jgi:hypothetical protein
VSAESAGHIHGWKKEGFCPQSEVNVKLHTIEVSIKVSQHVAPIVAHFIADCILHEYGKIGLTMLKIKNIIFSKYKKINNNVNNTSAFSQIFCG